MSVRQALVGLHRHIFRFRNVNDARQRLGQFGQQVVHQKQANVKDALRLGQQTVINGSHSAGSFSIFPKSFSELFRGLFSFAPIMAHRYHHFAGHVGRFIGIRGPGRTVAPLMGFIAAFLKETNTDEYKTETACLAVRDEVAGLSKDLLTGARNQVDYSSFQKLKDLDIGRSLGKGCNAAVYEARLKSDEQMDYDLAVKVLFNYSLHSDTETLSKMFSNELLPIRMRHMNIVDVFQACIDEIPVELPGAQENFPSALPARLHPQGLGRNQTMFVLMNKYSCTLREDLIKRAEAYDLDEGLVIFGQLLEGVTKMIREKVVHRDIKSDNILLAKSDDGHVERAVISDFGCSINALRLHFPYEGISRGGNRALMAPEIVNTEPGPLTWLDYSRSDLWSIGTVAHEILTGYNPFFEGLFPRSSTTYEEAFLPDVVPDNLFLNKLVRAILRRDPSKRPSPGVAATACHMILWEFPLDGEEKPSVESIHFWIKRLCVKLICGPRNGLTSQSALLATFLKRCNVAEISKAWKLLHD